jgi:hypothetical protein
MRPRRLLKTLRQATLRRRSAFYVLGQASEPDEEFVDPFSKRHDETVLSLIRRQALGRPTADPDQLELWIAARAATGEPAFPVQPRRLS